MPLLLLNASVADLKNVYSLMIWESSNESMTKYDEGQIDIDICSELETEMDEMWSFYLDKSHQIWLWWAVDHKTNTP